MTRAGSEICTGCQADLRFQTAYWIKGQPLCYFCNEGAFQCSLCESLMILADMREKRGGVCGMCKIFVTEAANQLFFEELGGESNIDENLFYQSMEPSVKQRLLKYAKEVAVPKRWHRYTEDPRLW